MENTTLTAPYDFRLELFSQHHDVRAFDCGVDSLNIFLQRYALAAPRQGMSQSWALVDAQDKVLGYFTLSACSVSHADATARAAKGIGRYDIPAILVARLAVDRSMHGQGLGGVLLEEALGKAAAIGRATKPPDEPQSLPVRCVLVHALDSNAASFYRHYGFEPSPTDPLHLLMLIKDIPLSIRER